MPRPRVNLPTVADYCAAILEAEGPFTVCGTYYGVGDDAEVQRRRTAERWCREDAARAEQIRRDMQAA